MHLLCSVNNELILCQYIYKIPFINQLIACTKNVNIKNCVSVIKSKCLICLPVKQNS